MKCIKKHGVIKRVTNEKAEILVNEKDWKYWPKSKWKEEVRDAVNKFKSKKKIEKSKQ